MACVIFWTPPKRPPTLLNRRRNKRVGRTVAPPGRTVNQACIVYGTQASHRRRTCLCIGWLWPQSSVGRQRYTTVLQVGFRTRVLSPAVVISYQTSAGLICLLWGYRCCCCVACTLSTGGRKSLYFDLRAVCRQIIRRRETGTMITNDRYFPNPCHFRILSTLQHHPPSI